jgi:hypothetical protein
MLKGRIQILQLLIIHFPPASDHHIMFSDTLSPWSSLNLRYRTSHQCKTTSTIIAFRILKTLFRYQALIENALNSMAAIIAGFRLLVISSWIILICCRRSKILNFATLVKIVAVRHHLAGRELLLSSRYMVPLDLRECLRVIELLRAVQEN